MALDASTKEVNIRGSIQKYFVDSLETTEGKNVIIDADVEPVRNLTEWIGLNFLDSTIGNKIFYRLQLIPATRQDAEGFKLAALEDLIMQYIYDENGIYRAIPFYDISDLSNLIEIGKIHLRMWERSSIIRLPDERTKFRILTVNAHISAKLITN